MCNNHSCRTYTVKQLPFFAFRTTGQFDKDTWLLRDNSAKSLGISSEFVSSGSNVARTNITMNGPQTSQNTATPQKIGHHLDYSRKLLKNQRQIATKTYSVQVSVGKKISYS